MIRYAAAILTLIITLTASLCGCTGESNGIIPDSERNDSEDTTEIPQDQDLPDIKIGEPVGLLSANGSYTNGKTFWLDDGASYHGGQQMRSVHTQRGIYAAFAKDFGGAESGGIQKYYVTKSAPDGNSSILHYGEFHSDTNDINVNIGQDTNGDIIVTVASLEELEVYVFDSATDEMTAYKDSIEFATGRSQGYSQVLFDFDARRIYAFYNDGAGTGYYVLEWHTFDLDSKKWSETGIFTKIEDIGRHCYLYPFNDGNGGAYIACLRAERASILEGQLAQLYDTQYIWDRIDLIHIPDLTSSEKITYTCVQECTDTQRGLEGVWADISLNENGDVYVDSSGLMHITYQYALYDYSGSIEDFDPETEYRHAVYNGMECVFNEKIEVPDPENRFYRPMIRERTDGVLHMILSSLDNSDGKPITFDFYRAKDNSGREWEHISKTELTEGYTSHSLSVSGKRDGSIQDDHLSCLFYGYKDLERTACTLDISLEDYSVTGFVDVLLGYGIRIDWRYDRRVPYYDHTQQIVNSGDSVYSAFVYKSDLQNRRDYFSIVKTDGNGNSSIIFSDTFKSSQDRYLTVSEEPNGIIYICPPTGYTIYTLDPSTDEVTLKTIAVLDLSRPSNNPQQTGIFFDPDTGDGSFLSASLPEYFAFSIKKFDSENCKIPFRIEEWSFDRELEGGYTCLNTVQDGGRGLYIIGTRRIRQSELGGKLEYEGFTQYADDSVMLFYIPNISDSESKIVRCADVETPREEGGSEGIWQLVRVKDAQICSDGTLNIIYCSCLADLDDADRRSYGEFTSSTLKHYLAVFKGTELISKTELGIEGLDSDSSLRLAETSDGTKYIIKCNTISSCEMLSFRRYPEGQEARITVYSLADGEWVLKTEKTLGQFAAEGLSTGYMQNSDDENSFLDTIVFASDNEVYLTRITFE